MEYKVLRSQIKRHSNEFLEFNSLLREHHLFIPSFDYFDLIDISLRFYTQPSLQPLITGQALFGVRDLRLYINGTDYTKYLKAELKSLLAAQNTAAAKRQYRKGAESWLSFLGKYAESFGVNMAEQKSKLDQILQSDLNQQFSTLGDKDSGFGGNLHILNYLYKDIEMDNLSVKRIINRRQKELGRPETDFSSFENIRITFSQGPSPSYDTPPETAFQPRGRIFYFMEFIYNNPIEEALQLILKKITDTQIWIELQRTNYLEPLKNQVDVLDTESKEKFKAYEKLISDLSKVVKEKFPDAPTPTA